MPKIIKLIIARITSIYYGSIYQSIYAIYQIYLSSDLSLHLDTYYTSIYIYRYISTHPSVNPSIHPSVQPLHCEDLSVRSQTLQLRHGLVSSVPYVFAEPNIIMVA